MARKATEALRELHDATINVPIEHLDPDTYARIRCANLADRRANWRRALDREQERPKVVVHRHVHEDAEGRTLRVHESRSEADYDARSSRGTGGGIVGSLEAMLVALAFGLLGAAAMYFMDPRLGARRRNVIKDKAASAARQTATQAGKQARYYAGVAQGAVRKAKAAVASDDPTDLQLAERVRAQLGHLTSHAADVTVSACQGNVLLEGRLPQNEIQPVVHALRSVRGVQHLEHRLQTGTGAGTAAVAIPAGRPITPAPPTSIPPTAPANDIV